MRGLITRLASRLESAMSRFARPYSASCAPSTYSQKTHLSCSSSSLVTPLLPRGACVWLVLPDLLHARDLPQEGQPPWRARHGGLRTAKMARVRRCKLCTSSVQALGGALLLLLCSACAHARVSHATSMSTHEQIQGRRSDICRTRAVRGQCGERGITAWTMVCRPVCAHAP